MLWVDQPVGTGFSIGEVTATNEEDIAADFVGFLLNFETIFGIKNFKIYVTGESYAGRYVPYISAAIIDKNDITHFDLGGTSPFSHSKHKTPNNPQERSSTTLASAPTTTRKKKPSPTPSWRQTTP
jgi:carboxypeptidase C (cathepsin A)